MCDSTHAYYAKKTRGKTVFLCEINSLYLAKKFFDLNGIRMYYMCVEYKYSYI